MKSKHGQNWFDNSMLTNGHCFTALSNWQIRQRKSANSIRLNGLQVGWDANPLSWMGCLIWIVMFINICMHTEKEWESLPWTTSQTMTHTRMFITALFCDGEHFEITNISISSRREKKLLHIYTMEYICILAWIHLTNITLRKKPCNMILRMKMLKICHTNTVIIQEFIYIWTLKYKEK